MTMLTNQNLTSRQLFPQEMNYDVIIYCLQEEETKVEIGSWKKVVRGGDLRLTAYRREYVRTAK